MNKKEWNNLEKQIKISKLISNINIKKINIEKYDGIKGNISYIAAANQNNGSRLDKTRNIYNETIFSKKIIWNTQGDGGAGLSFYHPYKFMAASTTLVCDTIEERSWKEKLFLSFAMSLEKKNRYHGNSITKKDKEITNIISQKNQLSKDKTQLEHDLQYSNNTITDLTRQKNLLQIEKDQIIDDKNALQKTIEDLNKDIRKAENKINKLSVI